MTERLHLHFSLSCTGEGNGSPLQCSCLETPRDGGAWWAAVYGVAQSRTRLKRLSSSSSSRTMSAVLQKRQSNQIHFLFSVPFASITSNLPSVTWTAASLRGFLSPDLLSILFSLKNATYTLKKKLIDYFWLCWVSVAASGLFLIAQSTGYASLQCDSVSLQWLPGTWAQLAAPWHVEFSRTRDQTYIPWIGRQIINYSITGEAQLVHFSVRAA